MICININFTLLICTMYKMEKEYIKNNTWILRDFTHEFTRIDPKLKRVQYLLYFALLYILFVLQQHHGIIKQNPTIDVFQPSIYNNNKSVVYSCYIINNIWLKLVYCV